MANKCKTALVDPPQAITRVMAFSKALRVMISLGFISLSNNQRIACPASRQSSRFSGDIASCAELPGKLIPKASIAVAIVLAVYIPPQEPGPGMRSEERRVGKE